MENRTDVSNDISTRYNALKTPVAEQLLSSLPIRISQRFIKSYLAQNFNNLDEVVEYFVQHSEITRIVKENPSSALTFEYLYHRRPLFQPIDQYFLKCKAGYQIYKRLVALRENLPRIIHGQLQSTRDKVLIDNIGSGPGHDMIDVVVEHPKLAQKVHVRNIDPDGNALEIGQKRTKELGLSGCFSFIDKKLEKTDPQDADMILLIGILCPLQRPMCELVLQKLKEYCRPGGIIVFSTAQTRMGLGDPLTDFIMRFAGWHMDYKTDEDTEDIARASGWEPLEQFFDEPLHYHCIQTARNRPQ
ncbi:MAG: hypothetical protein DRH12_17930 [Deltaproteobacteria bacterium]|nr:MAG: hypothetical protein DRH12_17930 [Deltaproteobacteria bacterium]